MPDRVRSCYPVVRIYLQTATEEVHKQGVSSGLGRPAVDEGSDEVPGQRRAAKPSSLGVSAGDDVGAAFVDRLDAVARYSAAGDEVTLALTRGQELLAGQTEHLDYTRDLVTLVFAGKQRVARQQLHYDAPYA